MKSKENQPLKKIPLPDYDTYRADICARHMIKLPLKTVSWSNGEILKQIPAPLASGRKGWPWDKASAVVFTDPGCCPKISVVVPSYQQGDFIEETLRSVILQNYPNVELLVMDGGSTDSTGAVIDHYANFISLALSEKDRGQSHAINKGFSMATGELYYWLNSDDYLNAECLNRLAAIFMKDPGLDIVYGHGLVCQDGRLNLEYAPLVKERYLRFGGVVLSHSVMWRQRVHRAVWEDLQCAMDAELWLRLFPGRRFRHVNFPIGVFRKHSQQKTALPALIQQWQSDFEQYIWPHYPAISKRAWARRALEYRMVQLFYRLLNPYPTTLEQP